VTANGPSTAPGAPIARPAVDLAGAGLLPPLPRAFLEGRDLDLLEPLRLLAPGALPEGGAPGPRPDRRRLAASLRSANRAYGHPGADRLSALLADPEAAVVVGGQQPGLFGGPLYTLSKMVAIGRWAEALAGSPAGGGRPAVAVFWVATEDHDWAEVSWATFLTPEGPRRFDLGPDPDPLLPLGMRTLGPAFCRSSQALPEIRSSERPLRWSGWTTLSRIYRPDARFGEAFCRWATEVLGDRCPLLLDAMDPAVKEAEAPVARRLVERRAEWEEDSAAADRRIEERGHPLQVHPQRGLSPLFELRGGERRRIEWSRSNGGGEGVYLPAPRRRGSAPPDRGPPATIADNPAVVSPGVLARPAIQDAILGTTLQVLGPGELSYMAQAAPAYRVLEVAAPWVALRPQTLVLEAHHREKLEELGIPLAALLGRRTSSSAGSPGRDGAGFVERARGEVEAALARLREAALAVDPNLERPFEKTREHLLRALDTFAGKATAAAARRDEVRSPGSSACAGSASRTASSRSGSSPRPTSRASTASASPRPSGSRWSSTAAGSR
jgi:bacillithiol synthase